MELQLTNGGIARCGHRTMTVYRNQLPLHCYSTHHSALFTSTHTHTHPTHTHEYTVECRLETLLLDHMNLEHERLDHVTHVESCDYGYG